MAFLVLFSTFSFTVEKHYCGDFLIDVSYTGKAYNCGMDMEAKALAKKKNCCKDEIQKIEGQDELQLSSIDKISFEKQQFLTVFIFTYNDLFSEFSTEKNLQKAFPPPDIDLDYQVNYQTFLI